MRIGIVGTGIAGASAAYFLREDFGEDVDVVAFERDARVGGRVRTVEVSGKRIEAGAKGIHSSNRYLLDFVDSFDLTREEMELLSGARMGVWDGESFVFRHGGSWGRTAVRFLGRYGLRSALGLTGAVLRERRAIGALRRLYTALDEDGEGFGSLSELLSFLDVGHLTGTTGRAYLRERNVSERCVDELFGGLTRWVYAQNPTVHVAATLGIPARGATGSFYQVAEGNVELCRALLDAADAEVRRNERVRRLVENGGQYTAVSADGREQFDAMIVAAPREVADVDMGSLDAAVGDREFQTVHLTYVLGARNPAYFGVEDADSVPEIVVTPAAGNAPFLGVNEYELDGPRSVFEVLSTSPVSEEELADMFAAGQRVEQVTWAGYPKLSPGTPDQPFRLQRGLYYVNAMESLVSTMETEVVGSRNVVNLLAVDSE